MKEVFTPYKSKFLKDFEGDQIISGAELEYRASAPSDRARLRKYGNKTLSGVFIGYDQRAGGDWSGDCLVVDWEELEQAENAREVHVKRVKEVNKLTLNGKLRFPLAEGILSQPAPGAAGSKKQPRLTTTRPVTKPETLPNNLRKNARNRKETFHLRGETLSKTRGGSQEFC
jgi:hypothetical protein